MNEFKKNIFKRRTEDIIPPISLFEGAISAPSSLNTICGTTTPLTVYIDTLSGTELTSGDVLYLDNLAVTPVDGLPAQFYYLNITDSLWTGINSFFVVQISDLGVISIDTICV